MPESIAKGNASPWEIQSRPVRPLLSATIGRFIVFFSVVYDVFERIPRPPRIRILVASLEQDSQAPTLQDSIHHCIVPACRHIVKRTKLLTCHHPSQKFRPPRRAPSCELDQPSMAAADAFSFSSRKTV